MRASFRFAAVASAALLLTLTPAFSQETPSGGSPREATPREFTPRARVSAAAKSLKGVSEGRPSQPGNPLVGITVEEFELFRIGLDDFLEVEDAAEGLGPAFNGLGCAQCHATPAIGGISPVAEVRAGHVDENGNFTVLGGDTLFHLFSLPNQECQPQIPPEANVIARRIPIPLFGAGLIEAIADEAIRVREDPNDQNGDGISGRAGIILDLATGAQRVGRFGWKAQHATLLAFGADAYRNEMGITNDLFRNEVGAGIDPEVLKLCDPASDPEDRRDPLTGLRGIDAFEAFMKFLAPLDRGPIDGTVVRGETLFTATGCASCHVPMMVTAQSRNPVFDRREVHLFSDLLLHDIATGDGIPQGDALASEIRTPALWGLRHRRPFLHDGSAATPEQALLRHGNEAQRAAENYRNLPSADKSALLAFLDSL